MASPFVKYLRPDHRIEAWQVFCTDAGFNEIQPGSDYPPRPFTHPQTFRTHLTDLAVGRTLEEFQVVYIHAGRGRFCTPPGPARAAFGGTALLLFPGVPHAYEPDPETGWEEYWVGFDGEYPRSLWQQGFIFPEQSMFHVGPRAELIHDYHQLFDEMMREAAGFQLRAGALAMHVLGSVLAWSMEEQVRAEAPCGDRHTEMRGTLEKLPGYSRETLLMKQALACMESHIYDHLSVEDLVAEVGVGYNQLRDAFVKNMGEAPYEHFLHMKIERAKQLLESTTAQVKDVAFTLGFQSPYYFSRLFRQKAGVAPREWKQTCAR